MSISTDTTLRPEPSTTPHSKPPSAENDIRFLIIPIVVVVLIMLLSLLVYLMAKRRHNQQMRAIILSMYELEEHDRDEWEPLNSYDHDSYDATQYNTSYV